MFRTLSIVTVLSLGALANANLIVNGSFEANTTVVTGGANDTADGWSKFTDFSAGSSPDVWDNNGVGGLAPGYLGFFVGMSAFHGTKFASVAGNPNLSNYVEGIESTSFNLTANTTYILSSRVAYADDAPFGYNSPAPLTARLRFGTNPTSVLTALPANTAPKTWQLRTYSFQVATSGSYSLILSAEGNDLNYLAVDDVSLTPVPEPGTLAALGFGLAVAVRKRRRG